MDCVRGSVLIVTDRLRGPVIEDVAEASRAAGMRPVCSPPGEPCGGGDRYSLVVGGLRPGERRIPPAMLSVAESSPDRTPLLLLCDEPLVRTTVSLEEGRVTLAEQPGTRGRLYSTVRMLLTSGGAPDTYAARAGAPISVWARRRPAAWAAEISTETCAPVVVEDDARGLTAVVPFERLEDGAAAAAVEAFRATGPDDRLAATLRDVLAARAGLVHLDAKTTEWTAWWPLEGAPLWISSARRLPSFFPLHLAARSGIVRLRASHGDVAAALAAAPPEDALPALRDATMSGGPALVDALGARFGAGAAGCVLEVR